MTRKEVADYLHVLLRGHLHLKPHTIFVEEVHVTTAIPEQTKRVRLRETQKPRAFLFPDLRVDFLAWTEAHGQESFTVYEIKSGIDDFKNDHKWQHYAQFGNHLVFVVPADFPISVIPKGIGILQPDTTRSGLRQVQKSSYLSLPDGVDPNRLKFLVARKLFYGISSKHAALKDSRKERKTHVG